MGLLLILPWLNPYTAGPAPAVWPWLLSAFCAVCLLLLCRVLGAELAATTWVVAASMSAAMGLLQYFGLAQALGPWVSQTNPGEAFGNLRQRNQFATLTSIGLVALIALLAQLRLRARRGATWRVPLWAYGVMLLLALGNAASSSRTGFFQWLLILLLSAWWARPALDGQRRLGAFAAQALLVYVVGVFALPGLLTALTGFTSGGLFGRLVDVQGCSSRRVLWSNVSTLIAQKPWLGWGWDELSYAHFINLYPAQRFCDILDNAHNLPLHLAVELGVPAAVSLCALACWMAWHLVPWRDRDPRRQMAWAVLAVIMLHSLLEYPLWYGPFQIAVCVCVWLLWSTQTESAWRTKAFNALALVNIRYVAIILVAILTWVAWDYWRVSQLYLPQAGRAFPYRDDTLGKVRNSWWFQNQVQFAELTTTPLASENAVQLNAMARQLLHFSPEPRVVEKLIESDVLLGRDDEALFYLQRFKAAFPQEHASWERASLDHKKP